MRFEGVSVDFIHLEAWRSTSKKIQEEMNVATYPESVCVLSSIYSISISIWTTRCFFRVHGCGVFFFIYLPYFSDGTENVTHLWKLRVLVLQAFDCAGAEEVYLAPLPCFARKSNMKTQTQ